MRKLILVLALLASTTVLAANWKMIIDGNGNTRLLVNTDSVRIDKYTKPDGTKGARVYAVMEFINDSNEVPFTAIIDGDDCLTQHGGTLVNVIDKQTTQVYFWSMDGAKLYDAEGQWLCGYLIGTMEVYKKQKDSKPKISM